MALANTLDDGRVEVGVDGSLLTIVSVVVRVPTPVGVKITVNGKQKS